MCSPNITYISNFYSQEECKVFFSKLSKYPFKQPVIKVYGKTYTPLRKSLSFADMDIQYEYSGYREVSLPWDQTMEKLKSDVEKRTGFSYNFVLLNYYENGLAKIGAHKDNEPSIDQTVDIATLSFGACRDIIFSKKGCKSVRKVLQPGSLLMMHDQKQWSHAIPSQPYVKEPRISLTFRKIRSSLEQSLEEMERDYSIPLCKRLRLE